ncbi:DNA-3-methyladenine glycosylase I [Bifidobacterium sp.]|uniref:DUF488 family protein, N3 subclade n=1 Tax=Bifidobacterium sp. TaxID=41200 RepID=UPI0039EAACF3
MGHSIIVERVYSRQPDAGHYRVLVDRLWPRGISRRSLRLDLWAKEIAPSTQLRQWFAHRPERFQEFRNRYVSQLDASGYAEEFAQTCSETLRERDIALLYAAKDERFNHARVLLDWLQRHGVGKAEAMEVHAHAAEASDSALRCSWARVDDELMVRYHDREWGTPNHDRRALFELLSLELMQSGLSWRTILHKREAMDEAFHGFDIERVAAMGAETDELLHNEGIVRNRLKIRAIVNNAKTIVRLASEGIDFADYVWSFVGGVPVVNRQVDHGSAPSSTALSEHMSRQMKRDGFNFVGPVVAHSFMEASGMVNDHEIGCFRHAQIAALAEGDDPQ